MHTVSRHILSKAFRVYNVLISMLICAYPHAQSIQFERIPNELGLSQNFISCLYQDQKGYLWVGTKDGLNRFDGYQFKVFRSDAFDSTSLSDNYIKAIFEDRNGRFWIGTTNGLNMMDRERETFRQIMHQPDDPNTLSHKEVNDIVEDNEGNIWVMTAGGGLNKLALKSDEKTPIEVTFTHFPTSVDNPSLWPRSAVNLEVDESGSIWIQGYSGLYRVDWDSLGQSYEIDRIEWEDLNPKLRQNKIEDFLYNENKQIKVDKRIYAIFKGNNGQIWVETAAGFAEWDANQKVFQFRALDAKASDYPTYPLEGANFGIGMEDQNNNLWVGGVASMVIVEPVSGAILERYHSQEVLPPGMPTAGVISLLEDDSGIIWAGTNGNGLYKYAPQLLRFDVDQHTLRWQGSSIRAIYQTSDGVIWLGSNDRHLYQLNTKTRAAQPVIINPNLERSRNKEEFVLICTMVEDRSGILWLGSSHGLWRFIQKDGQVSDLKLYPVAQYSMAGLSRNGILDIHEDEEGKLWLLTLQEFGWFDQEKEIFIGTSYLPVTGGDGSPGNYPCIHQQKNSTFWLGTSDGLLKYEPDSKKYTLFASDTKNRNSLINNVVKSICPDPSNPEKILWIGTGGGLNRFDLEKETFEHFTIENGLPDQVIYGVLSDEEGYLWMSTNQGISRMDPSKRTFKNYKDVDGLQDNEFNSAAYFKSKDGQLFFGGINGLNAFYPNAIKNNNIAPPVVITDFKLSNQSVDFKTPDAPFPQAISHTDEITLSYKDKIFSFEFAALDFTDPSRNEYAYQLEGFHKDWQFVGTQRTATFTNISPGTYIFRVKGTNNDGQWNEAGTSVKIVILPPWWQTWWAYTLFAILLGGGIAALYQFNLRRQLAQQEALRLQELNNLKSRLYTNVTHEFRTPLTVIMGMAEQTPHVSEVRSVLNIIHRNSKNLLRMVNQLLDLAKLESKSMKLELTQSNIIAYLRYLTESFQSMAEEQQLELIFQTDVEVLMMDFDEGKIQQIIYNLLSNAIKFTPVGGRVVLSSNTLGVSKTPRVLELKIQDTGIGIPPDKLSHIFDRFFQVDSSTTRKAEGTGIGLALTKELVELMGGQIAVESEPGNGTTFIIQLPVTQNAPEAKSILDAKPVKSIPEKTNVKKQELAPMLEQSAVDKPLLLIIEDNRDVVTYIRRCVEKDYQVESAANGQIGVDKALELIPDIIISDVMMPEKDGYEVTETLKNDERTSHIPIILLTAKATQEDKVTGLKFGADAYLMKPFHKEELLVRLENLVELRRQLQEKYRSGLRPVEEISSKAPSLDDIFLQKITTAIEEKLDNSDLNVEYLCQSVFLSHTQVYRKIKALTGKTPTLLIRSIRLQKGKELLATTNLNVSQVAYQVGFNDPNYFSRTFQQEFGVLPSSIVSN